MTRAERIEAAARAFVQAFDARVGGWIHLPGVDALRAALAEPTCDCKSKDRPDLGLLYLCDKCIPSKENHK